MYEPRTQVTNPPRPNSGSRGPLFGRPPEVGLLGEDFFAGAFGARKGEIDMRLQNTLHIHLPKGFIIRHPWDPLDPVHPDSRPH